MKRIVGVTYCDGLCIGVTVDGIIDDNTQPDEHVHFERVVRCKDCKHGKPDIMCDDYTACEYRQTIMPNSGFCSYGEREDVIQK